jgi:hypothetical protein
MSRAKKTKVRRSRAVAPPRARVTRYMFLGLPTDDDETIYVTRLTGHYSNDGTSFWHARPGFPREMPMHDVAKLHATPQAAIAAELVAQRSAVRDLIDALAVKGKELGMLEVRAFGDYCVRISPE